MEVICSAVLGTAILILCGLAIMQDIIRMMGGRLMDKQIEEMAKVYCLNPYKCSEKPG